MYVQYRRTRVEIWTPAKLNLFLEVLGRRADGYHEIETLMVPIDLFDTLRMSLRDDDQTVFAVRWAVADAQADRWGDVPAGPSNLVIRAVEALRRHALAEGSGNSPDRTRSPHENSSQLARGLQIELGKRIPAAAGLGGGSSDAAAALVGANRLWELGWSHAQLARVAAEIGSDVPFFLAATASICRGRGEQVAPLSTFAPLDFVVVRPPVGLSTAEVYRHTKLAESPRRLEADWRSTAADLQTRGQPRPTGVDPPWGRTHALAAGMFNRLQMAAAELAPWLEPLRREFQRLDCLGHQMSGSGSSYFGVCRNARHANRVAAVLRSRGVGSVFSVRSCRQDGRAFSRASQN